MAVCVCPPASDCPAEGGGGPTPSRGQARGRDGSHRCAGCRRRRRAHHPRPPHRSAARSASSSPGGACASSEPTSGAGGRGCGTGGGRRARRQGEQRCLALLLRPAAAALPYRPQICAALSSLPLLPLPLLLLQKKKGRGPWHKFLKEVKKVGAGQGCQMPGRRAVALRLLATLQRRVTPANLPLHCLLNPPPPISSYCCRCSHRPQKPELLTTPPAVPQQPQRVQARRLTGNQPAGCQQLRLQQRPSAHIAAPTAYSPNSTVQRSTSRHAQPNQA